MTFEDTNRKVAIVTGGATGIGYATAATLVEDGVDVLLVGRRRDRLEAAARALKGTSTSAVAVCACDIAALEAPELVLEAAVARFGHVDFLCNNAGIDGEGRYLTTST